jgi:hypothetical protein
MDPDDGGPFDTVGWGPFALPGERERLREAEERRVAEVEKMAAPAASEQGADEEPRAAAYRALMAVAQRAWANQTHAQYWVTAHGDFERFRLNQKLRRMTDVWRTETHLARMPEGESASHLPWELLTAFSRPSWAPAEEETTDDLRARLGVLEAKLEQLTARFSKEETR